jgi:hypothetical protein
MSSRLGDREVLPRVVRLELARAGLRGAASILAAEPLPGRRRRRRGEHLRNGTGALLLAASDVAWRSGFSSAWHATRKPVRQELQYALSEFGQVRLHRRNRSRVNPWYVGFAVGGVAAAVAARSWSSARHGAE